MGVACPGAMVFDIGVFDGDEFDGGVFDGVFDVCFCTACGCSAGAPADGGATAPEEVVGVVAGTCAVPCAAACTAAWAAASGFVAMIVFVFASFPAAVAGASPAAVSRVLGGANDAARPPASDGEAFWWVSCAVAGFVASPVVVVAVVAAVTAEVPVAAPAMTPAITAANPVAACEEAVLAFGVTPFEGVA